MAVVVLPTLARPTIWAGVNAASSLARGLIRWVPCSHNLPVGYDVIAPAKSATLGTAFTGTRVPAPSGGSELRHTTATDDFVRLPTGSDFAKNADLTVAMWYHHINFTANVGICEVENTPNGGNPAILWRKVATNTIRLRSGSLNPSLGWPNDTLVLGRMYLLVYRWTVATTTMSGWVNAVLQSYVGTFINGYNDYLFMCSGLSGGTGTLGGMHDVMCWNRSLSDAEVYALYEPSTRWSLYWTPSRRAYLDLGAVAAATASASEQTGTDTIRSSNW